MQTLTFITLITMAIVAVVSQTADVRLVERVDLNDGFGNFVSFYKLSDGTVVEQRETFRNAGTPNEEFVISGFYYYIAPNGEAQLTEYVADKDGDHKNTTSGPGVPPVPVPVPPVPVPVPPVPVPVPPVLEPVPPRAVATMLG